MSKRDRPRRTGLRRLIPTWRVVLGTVLGFLLLCGGAFAVAWMVIDVPNPNDQVKQQSNTWLYRDGSQIARTGSVNRENVKISEISKSVQHAAVAAENRTFYEDQGVDPIGLLRAGYETLSSGEKQGGSTITQQFVKNYYLEQSQTATRKAKELFISMKVDQKMSKDKILEGYLNSSYYGRNAYGIQAAARAYYDVDAEDLTTAQGAYLATLLNAPSLYDVSHASKANHHKAVARWNYILDGMVKKGWLTKDKRAGMKFPEPQDPKPTAGLSGQKGYLVNAAKKYVIKHNVLTEQELQAGGWRITTTFDKKRQKKLTRAVNNRVSDKLDPKARKVDGKVRVGGASVEPSSGKVAALYGGPDYLKQYVNNATRRDYQVGSTFKAFVLASALERHAKTQDDSPITPQTRYDGSNRRPVRGTNSKKPYAPPNEGDKDYGSLTVQEAMNHSVNAVFAQMAVDVGPEQVKQAALKAGLPKDKTMRAYPSIALGVTTHSPLNMAGSYATLANHGEQQEPWTVSKVEGNGGSHPDMPKHTSTRAFTKNTAANVTKVLRGVIDDDSGTGHAARALNRPAAGKTGTTDDNKSAWFVGYTPRLSTAIGMFGQDPKTGKQVSIHGLAGGDSVHGGAFPAEIWTDYMKSALDGTPVRNFDTAKPPAPNWTPPQEQSPSNTPSETPETPSRTPENTPSEEPSSPPESSNPPPDTPTPTPSDTPPPSSPPSAPPSAPGTQTPPGGTPRPDDGNTGLPLP